MTSRSQPSLQMQTFFFVKQRFFRPSFFLAEKKMHYICCYFVCVILSFQKRKPLKNVINKMQKVAFGIGVRHTHTPL